jgi:uncharacterized membrane protein
MSSSPDIKTKVLEKISHGDVHRRSKAYFVAQIVLIVALLAVAFALSVFVLSFVIFSVRESGEQFLLGFGRQGIVTFFILFPWVALVLDTLLLVAIEWLSRSFKFGYRIPIARALLGVLALALLGGIIVDLTPLHGMLLSRADDNELPVVGEWYESIHESHKDQGVFRGVVTAAQGNGFTMTHDDGDHDADDGTWSVIVPAGFDVTAIAVGDGVYVAGNVVQGVVQAYGVQKL